MTRSNRADQVRTAPLSSEGMTAPSGMNLATSSEVRNAVTGVPSSVMTASYSVLGICTTGLFSVEKQGEGQEQRGGYEG